MKNISQNDFKRYVLKFHADHDTYIKSMKVGETWYIKDKMSDAINIVNRHPENIEMFFIIANTKLSISTETVIDGERYPFNRGQQRP